MAKDELPDKKRQQPQVVSPSTRVTVAFPFSNIKMAEPSQQLRELAEVVLELAEQIAKVQPSADTDVLVQRARALLTKL